MSKKPSQREIPPIPPPIRAPLPDSPGRPHAEKAPSLVIRWKIAHDVEPCCMDTNAALFNKTLTEVDGQLYIRDGENRAATIKNSIRYCPFCGAKIVYKGKPT